MRHIKDEPYLLAKDQVDAIAHNGSDITSRCFAFDEARGFAYFYVVTNGKIELAADGSKKHETLNGTITCILGGVGWQRGLANQGREPQSRQPIPRVAPKKPETNTDASA